jgi:peroxiredoxin
LDARKKTNVEILAVAVDSREDLQKMVDRVARESGHAPDFSFLSDPGHRVIDRYGLLNPNGRGGTIPHPTTLVIDRSGIVRWKFVEVNYRIRPTNQMILDALRSLEKK